MPNRTVILGAQMFDGTGTPSRPCEVLVEGNRISAVAETLEHSTYTDAEIIDGRGATLMPGLVDGHAHLGFGSTIEHLSNRTEPDEEKTLLLAHAGRVMLDSGFTSAYSGGNRLPRTEVAARKAWAEGWLPGPRIRAASWEGSAGMTTPGHYDFPGIEDRPSDPEGISRFVHDMADIGVDIVKLSLSGESAVVAGSSRVLQFTEEEVAAAASAARERHVWLTAHAHSSEAIQLALRHGVRAIYHATFADDETIDLLAAARDRVFVAPTPGIIWAHLHDTDEPPEDGMEVNETAASIQRVAPLLHARGVRLVPGGDYGFSFNPVGKNARDLRLFVDWFGFTPADALRAATQYGGQIMDMADELGVVREGFLADLLLVDGDPTQDITLMTDATNLSMIMKDGGLHKVTASRRNSVLAGR
jgi:imidazolonepropionase-like amidohydrolase